MAQTSEILFIDDDRIMRKKYRSVFESEGFVVRTAKNGEEGVAAFLEKRPSVIVLDMMMPKMNGLETCKALRAHDANVPILFLSCVADDTKQLRAYDSGADDYVAKDANDDLLVAKVRAVLRRSEAASGAAPSSDFLGLGTVRVDLKSGEVTHAGEAAGRLTRTELDILKILAGERGQVFSRDELIARLRGEGFACEDAMLYTHILNLRRKLGAASGLLACSRGIGYSLIR